VVVRMRILLVEDDPEVVAVFREEFSSDAFQLHHAATRDEALALLGTASFDVAVCDLRLPSAPGALDEEVGHGRAVLTRLVRSYSGTPAIAFSAYGSVSLMQELLRRARQEDFLGEGQTRQMLTFFTKDQLPDCVALLQEMKASIGVLEAIEIATGLERLDLSWEEERILRIYARRLGATVIRAAALTGGKSGSRVLRLRLEATGAHVASVVAKIDALERVSAEQQKVENYVSPALPSGAYPSAVTLLRAGAGKRGGLVYSFAGGFEKSLADAIRAQTGAEPVERLRAVLSPWRDGAPVEETTLNQVRECLVESGDIPEEHRALMAGEEGVEVSVRKCTGHRDLHVYNVLLSDAGNPMIIDFAAVGPAPVSVDPISLELSLVFHPDARHITGDWPSVEQAECWDDVDTFTQGCPDREFVGRCRQWSFEVAAGDREVFGAMYAYALRQLKFSDTPDLITTGLIRCARRRLGM
jgi:CheY-like chemotaxis protein